MWRRLGENTHNVPLGPPQQRRHAEKIPARQRRGGTTQNGCTGKAWCPSHPFTQKPAWTRTWPANGGSPSVEFSPSIVSRFATPGTAAHQASLSITNSWACPNSCPSSQWCHPTISSFLFPFSSYLQCFPASGSFLMSQFFASGGQSIGASASVFPLQRPEEGGRDTQLGNWGGFWAMASSTSIPSFSRGPSYTANAEKQPCLPSSSASRGSDGIRFCQLDALL